MQMIITMAGEGRRFRDAGYDCPKYMIMAKGKSLFEWSMDSLVDFNFHVSQYLFVVRKEDGAREFILNHMDQYGINHIEIMEIDHLTDGQATTCMMAIPLCNTKESIMVYNIDTYVEPYGMKYRDIDGEGYIPCFHASGSHWSFVKIDGMGRAIEVREKVRISDNCTLGAYYFASAGMYERIYRDLYIDGDKMENTEKYIAPMYNYMIDRGMKISISIVDSKKVHVLGTPEELEIFKAI